MTSITFQLKNISVNSGVAVSLFTQKYIIAWKNLTDTKPIPSAFDISEVDFVGYEGPIITIKCIIDSVNLSNYLTYNQLIDFVTRRTNDTYLKLLNNGNGLGGRPTSGYSSTVSNTLDTTNGFKVQLKSFTITSNKSEDDNENKLNCDLVFTETA